MTFCNLEGQSIAQELRAITNEAKAAAVRRDEALVQSAHDEIVKKCREVAMTGGDDSQLSLNCFVNHESHLADLLIEALKNSGLKVQSQETTCGHTRSCGLHYLVNRFYLISW